MKKRIPFAARTMVMAEESSVIKVGADLQDHLVYPSSPCSLNHVL